MNEMTVTVGMTVLTEMPDINELAELTEWDEDSVITTEKNDTYYLEYPQYSEEIDYSYMDWLSDTLCFWCNGILLVIIGSIGLSGNILTLAVLAQPKMRKSVFYNLLLALACFDTFFILSFGIRNAYLCFLDQDYFKFGFEIYLEGHFCLIWSIYMNQIGLSFRGRL